jgi:hypothetical protein
MKIPKLKRSISAALLVFAMALFSRYSFANNAKVFDRRCGKVFAAWTDIVTIPTTSAGGVGVWVPVIHDGDDLVIQYQQGVGDEWEQDTTTPDVAGLCFNPPNGEPGVFRVKGQFSGSFPTTLHTIEAMIGRASGTTPADGDELGIGGREVIDIGEYQNLYTEHIFEIQPGDCIAVGFHGILGGVEAMSNPSAYLSAEQMDCRDEIGGL